jgi:hypothetical protein
MPHQDTYLALLDQQASAAMAWIEEAPKDGAAAKKRAGAIAMTIEFEYYDPAEACYAFSRNADGSLNCSASPVERDSAGFSGSTRLGFQKGREQKWESRLIP